MGRGRSWLEAEDVCLCRAYVRTTADKPNDFLGTMTRNFAQMAPPETAFDRWASRTSRALQKRLKLIRPAVARFCSLYRIALANNPSRDHEAAVTAAQQMYALGKDTPRGATSSRSNLQFKYMHCWEVLRNSPPYNEACQPICDQRTRSNSGDADTVDSDEDFAASMDSQPVNCASAVNLPSRSNEAVPCQSDMPNAYSSTGQGLTELPSPPPMPHFQELLSKSQSQPPLQSKRASVSQEGRTAFSSRKRMRHTHVNDFSFPVIGLDDSSSLLRTAVTDVTSSLLQAAGSSRVASNEQRRLSDFEKYHNLSGCWTTGASCNANANVATDYHDGQAVPQHPPQSGTLLTHRQRELQQQNAELQTPEHVHSKHCNEVDPNVTGSTCDIPRLIKLGERLLQVGEDLCGISIFTREDATPARRRQFFDMMENVHLERMKVRCAQRFETPPTSNS